MCYEQTNSQLNENYLLLTLMLPVFLVLKMLLAYYICCIIFSKALQNTFAMEANFMNSDQTAPKMSRLFCYQSTYTDERADDNCREWQRKCITNSQTGLFMFPTFCPILFVS